MKRAKAIPAERPGKWSGAPEPSPDEARVDLPVARRQLAGLLLGAGAFVATGAWMLATRPDPVVAGLGLLAIAFFGLCGLVALRDLVRRGPVLSVSAYGLFDRRFSTEWIPWSALDGCHVAGGVLSVAVRPERDAALPLTHRARWIARFNRIVLHPRDPRFASLYWMPCQGVAGGGEAVAEAIARVLGGPRRRR
ncbi:STM3941 family protein [Methylobacterium oryzisoli]|uniref:STM3941 family protein n=1 Tax=Methylobacterium oryzisoli TaxID=3385502 RepID=UPI0038913D56